LFPTAHAELFAEILTSVVWNAASITDNVDGINCIISRLAVLSSNSGLEVALVATNLPNSDGAAAWLPAGALQVPDVQYAIAVEARDQAGNAASNTFWRQSFTVVPEPGVLLAAGLVAFLAKRRGKERMTNKEWRR